MTARVGRRQSAVGGLSQHQHKRVLQPRLDRAQFADGDVLRLARRLQRCRALGAIGEDAQQIAVRRNGQHAVARFDDAPRAQRIGGTRLKDNGGERVAQRARIVAREQLSAMHQADARAAFRFVEVRCADNDGRALQVNLGHQVPELAATHRVNAGRRFVEQEHARRVHQRGGEREFFLHPAGEMTREARAKFVKARESQQARDEFGARGARRAKQIGKKVQVLDDGQIGIERKALRHIADDFFDRFGIARRFDAVHQHAPQRGIQGGGDEAERCRLARAIGPNQAENFARVNLEREVVDGDGRGEAFGEMLDGNHV